MKRLVGSLILAAALLVPAAASASAAGAVKPQQQSDTIFACVLNNTSLQNVRIVHENTNCKKTEHSLSWDEYDVGEHDIIQACVLKNTSQQNFRIISGQPAPKVAVQPNKKIKLCSTNENLLQWEYDPDGDIFACVLNNTSQQNVRIVHAGTNCSTNEFALSWDSDNVCNAVANTTCVEVRNAAVDVRRL